MNTKSAHMCVHTLGIDQREGILLAGQLEHAGRAGLLCKRVHIAQHAQDPQPATVMGADVASFDIIFVFEAEDRPLQ
eukprot:7914397-Karenia_brevis.AAC.1